MKKSIETVSVFGLGKLGFPTALVVASKGYRVIGVDTNESTIRLIENGVSPITEPGVEELLKKHRKMLTVTCDGEKAVRDSDATFIIVPTPSDTDGGFSLRYVLPACKVIGRGLRGKRDYHLVVLTSTVMPGDTRGAVQPALERASGRRCGDGWGLCYNPEFVALGSVIKNFLSPDFVLIGESDPEAGERLSALYRTVCENNPEVVRMNFVNAELTKLALNTFVTTKITFANMLARMCERIPGGDVDIVTSALGLDKRIGSKYLKGGMGYGGPCFPRDNIALVEVARRLGVSSQIPKATDTANREHTVWLANLLSSWLPPGSCVAVLGLTYKPGTCVVEESQGMTLARDLLSRDFVVRVYDPAGMAEARKILGEEVSYAPTAEMCVERADAVVIVTPWEEFKRIRWNGHNNGNNRQIIVDCWRILDPSRLNGQTNYVALGRDLGPIDAELRREEDSEACPELVCSYGAAETLTTGEPTR